jgi:hypothetical protein
MPVISDSTSQSAHTRQQGRAAVSKVREFVLNVIQQIFRVPLEFAVRMELQATPEGRLGTPIERRHIRGWFRAAGLMSGELSQPSHCIPESRIIGTNVDGVVDDAQALFETVLAGDQQRRQVLQRASVRCVQRNDLARERD